MGFTEGELIAVIPNLKGFARRLCRGNDDQVDDLVQDSLARAWENRHQYEPAGKLASWCCKIMHNIHASYWRVSRPEQFSCSDEALYFMPGADRADSRCMFNEMIDAVERLPAVERELLCATALTDQQSEEIGRPFDMNKNQVRQHVSRTREKLRMAFA